MDRDAATTRRSAPSSSSSSRFAPVLLMCAMAGAYLALFPLLPAFQAEHGFSTAAIGLLGATGFAAAVAAELVLGPRADHGHARRIVGLAVAAMALSLVGHAVATELWQFLALRALAGAAFGAFVPALNAEAIRAAPLRAGAQLGRLQSAELIGLAVGPLLAALAVRWWPPAVALVALGGVVLLALPLVRGIGDPGASGGLPAPAGTAAARRGRVLPLDLLRAPGVRGAVLLTVAFMVPIGAYDSLWPRYLADLGASELLVGLSYTIFAIPFAVLATTAGRHADRVGGLRAAWSGLAVMLPCLIAYGFVTDPWLANGLGFLESGGQAFISVAAAAAVAHTVPTARAAGGQSLARATGTLVAALVAAAAGPLYAAGGARALFLATAAATLAVMAAATVALRRVGRTRPGGADPVPPAPVRLPLAERRG